MTDREMLELAARAAGLKEFTEINGRFAVRTRFTGMQDWSPWNPLTDDCDALRLAVDLRFEIDVTDSGVAVRTRCGLKVLVNKTEEPDLRAAARLAITRAAAEIGRQMEEPK